MDKELQDLINTCSDTLWDAIHQLTEETRELRKELQGITKALRDIDGTLITIYANMPG